MKWLALIFLVLAGCRKSPRPPLTTEAYVWQSTEKPAVQAAMNRARGLVTTYHVRAAELRWTGERFAIQRFVGKLPSPGCGLVVRIGASASRLEWTPGQIEEVAKVFRELALLRPSEIQCDFDCPQKRLGPYQKLLTKLRSAAGTIPVPPTTLPSWLGEPAFRQLVQGREYVLQVHSLQLPKRPEDPPEVFAPETARTAVNKAAALGAPFRVAMATYGCEVLFSPDGKVVDVISEDTGSTRSVSARRTFALADPAASARLVHEWTADPPAGLKGVIWYRLPVEGDQRNWPWETFQLVVQGKEAASPAEFEASPGPGARDLHVANHGQFPLRLPAGIIVTSPVVAADGAGAYQLEARDGGLHFVLRGNVWPWLDPGKKIPAGWLRTREESARIVWHIFP